MKQMLHVLKSCKVDNLIIINNILYKHVLKHVQTNKSNNMNDNCEKKTKNQNEKNSITTEQQLKTEKKI